MPDSQIQSLCGPLLVSGAVLSALSAASAHGLAQALGWSDASPILLLMPYALMAFPSARGAESAALRFAPVWAVSHRALRRLNRSLEEISR